MSEERRLVTVLFADVTGSTAMGEQADPEALRVLLTRFYGIAKEVVASYGGTLEKFIGDAVMAVFGLPAELEAGIRVLEGLGDFDYLSRVEQYARRRGD